LIFFRVFGNILTFLSVGNNLINLICVFRLNEHRKVYIARVMVMNGSIVVINGIIMVMNAIIIVPNDTIVVMNDTIV
jgi:hypothetical protein